MSDGRNIKPLALVARDSKPEKLFLVALGLLVLGDKVTIPYQMSSFLEDWVGKISVVGIWMPGAEHTGETLMSCVNR